MCRYDFYTWVAVTSTAMLRRSFRVEGIYLSREDRGLIYAELLHRRYWGRR